MKKIKLLALFLSVLFVFAGCVPADKTSISSAPAESEAAISEYSTVSQKEQLSVPAENSSQEETSSEIEAEPEHFTLNDVEALLEADGEKVLCTATIDSEFADDCILIVLKKTANYDLEPLTEEYFSELELEKIEGLTQSTVHLVKAGRQMLKNEADPNCDHQAENAKILKELGTTHTIDQLKHIATNHNEIYSLYLKDKGKQKVLDAIKILEKRDDILSAEPNFIRHVAD